MTRDRGAHRRLRGRRRLRHQRGKSPLRRHIGLAGIERFFDETLSAGAAPVELAIDLRVQHAVHEELSAAVETFGAIGAVGVAAFTAVSVAAQLIVSSAMDHFAIMGTDLHLFTPGRAVGIILLVIGAILVVKA